MKVLCNHLSNLSLYRTLFSRSTQLIERMTTTSANLYVCVMLLLHLGSQVSSYTCHFCVFQSIKIHIHITVVSLLIAYVR